MASSAYAVADAFLNALGAPRTTSMRRAVAIWLRFESGSNVVGNNPWNLHGGAPCPKDRGYCPGNVGVHKGQIGNRYAGPGDQNVAVFATMDDGAKASAANLERLAPSYGYGKVISAARTGNGLRFLEAIQASSWSAGHYGYAKLVNAFMSGGGGNFTITTSQPAGTSAARMGSTRPQSDRTKDDAAMLGGWGDLVKFPTGHVLTAADVDTIVTTLRDHGFFAPTDPILGAIGEGITRDILMRHVGEKWDKSLQERLQAEFGQAATDAVSGTAAFRAVGDALGKATDPANWVRILALFAGAALVGFGGYGILRAT